ncbi:MAG: thioredoxin family protein [Candidatus Heimdallarchaeota archaeon]
MPKLDTIKTKGVSPNEFIRTIKLEKYRKMFKRGVEGYKIKEEVLEQISEITKTKKFAIRVFAADWCKDTRKALPALSIIMSRIPEIDLKILGGIKNVPFDPNIRWKVPPSPPEVDTFDIRAIPTIIIFDKNGEEVGRMVEHPEATETIEEELLYHLQMLQE